MFREQDSPELADFDAPEDDFDDDDSSAAPAAAAAAQLPPGERPVHLDEHGKPRIIERRIVVEDDYDGWRLDLYLKRCIPRLSRTRIQGIVRDWLVTPNGRTMKPHSPVRAGDVLIVRREARSEPPFPRHFDVLVDEPTFLVVDKPANLPVHASARYYYGTLTRLLDDRFPGQELQIAHRIDRETSGCLVVARGRVAAATLKGAFEKRRVSKVYQALVHGTPEWPEGHVIDLPLALAPKERSALGIRMEPAADRPDGLPAQTRVKVVERFAGGARVECRPITGRQHQIRAHLAAVGHPIIGDKLYAHGDEAFRRYCHHQETLGESELIAEFGLARQALHAAAITFPHPTTGAPFTVECPLAADMKGYIETRA
jgi:23S rRNA pseudouridine1911/1915/1917 synthase